jgi:hypothetical protein
MENQDKNIVDDLLISNSYIILLSGLEKSPIIKVSEDLVSAFSSYVIDLDFMHLPFNDRSDKIKNRLSDVLAKKQIIIVRAQNYDGNMSFKNTHIVRINLSINSQLSGDAELSSQYKAALLDSGINKYFNFKTDMVEQDYINSIYWYIIDDIERRVYGSQYKQLSHKYFLAQKLSKEDKISEVSETSNNNIIEFKTDSPNERFDA